MPPNPEETEAELEELVPAARFKALETQYEMACRLIGQLNVLNALLLTRQG